MPCRSDYLKANDREIESKRVAGHLFYLFSSLEQESNITDEIKTDKDHYYGNENKLDEWTALLCGTIRKMTKNQKDKFIYDGKNTKARALANWWKRHQAWDKKRKAQERVEKKLKQSDNLTEQFDKLSIEEKQRLLALVKTKGTS